METIVWGNYVKLYKNRWFERRNIPDFVLNWAATWWCSLLSHTLYPKNLKFRPNSNSHTNIHQNRTSGRKIWKYQKFHQALRIYHFSKIVWDHLHSKQDTSNSIKIGSELWLLRCRIKAISRIWENTDQQTRNRNCSKRSEMQFVSEIVEIGDLYLRGYNASSTFGRLARARNACLKEICSYIR